MSEIHPLLSTGQTKLGDSESRLFQLLCTLSVELFIDVTCFLLHLECLFLTESGRLTFLQIVFYDLRSQPFPPISLTLTKQANGLSELSQPLLDLLVIGGYR